MHNGTLVPQARTKPTFPETDSSYSDTLTSVGTTDSDKNDELNSIKSANV
jgi:hypothetical protein